MIPAPIGNWGGVPVYDRDGQEIARQLTLDALADLGGYLLGVRQWMEAAQACLEAQQ